MCHYYYHCVSVTSFVIIVTITVSYSLRGSML